jgi:hypothetical protein
MPKAPSPTVVTPKEEDKPTEFRPGRIKSMMGMSKKVRGAAHVYSNVSGPRAEYGQPSSKQA